MAANLTYEATMENFVPCYSIYISETAQRAYAGNFLTNAAAVAFAEKTLKKFVIRRSMRFAHREIYRGMIVHTKG